MFEVRSKTHINRYFADSLRWSDFFLPVQYFGFRGKGGIPWYYKVARGMTCCTDLSVGMEAIMASMKSNTRNEIRRAEREGVRFEVVQGYDEFIPFYNEFCSNKGLSDYTSRARMQKFPKLLVTRVVHDGQVLAMHTNILDEKSRIALLQFSCSTRLAEGVDRKMVGWANRYLHYKDLEWLTNSGYSFYDWSGVCVNRASPQYTIGQFKLSFGGVLTESVVLRTPVFVMLCFARRLFQSARSALRNKFRTSTNSIAKGAVA